MTLEEVIKEYGYSKSSWTTKFKRTQESVLKKTGIRIVKIGKGDKATYRADIVDDQRADNMFEEQEKKMLITSDSIGLMSIELISFLGIITTPMMVFRGTLIEYLQYLKLTVNDSNLQAIQQALQTLEEKGLIVKVDDDDIMVLSLKRTAENELQIGVNMIRDCRLLAQKNQVQDWTNLLKLWLGIEFLEKTQPFTQKELSYITGLSPYMIRKCSKILEQSNVFKTSRVYATYECCLGTVVDLNAEAFYNIE